MNPSSAPVPHGQAVEARAALARILTILGNDQERSRAALNLTPSENILSPLARLPFVLDVYSRYFFDHKRKFGAWSFYGGLEPGQTEYDVLHPVLRTLTDAPYVNAQPISGLSCMMVAIGALTKAGDTMLTVPTECGGHISTRHVAERLGARVIALPMRGLYDVDLDGLRRVLAAEQPALVYLDQSTQLFPIDPRPIRDCIDLHSPRTLLHFDSSHINGLVLFGALPNPLDRGAHSFGGSTHKTLPGPHKGFLATRSAELASRIDDMSGVFVSHHHPADVLSLTITLLELQCCDGATYARRVLENAQQLARCLHECGVHVAAAERNFTGCHQVWVDPADDGGAVQIAERLLDAGIVVNRLGDVPGFSKPAFRISVAEVTRLGATSQDIDDIAELLVAALAGADGEALQRRSVRLQGRLNRPKYCLDMAALDGADLKPEMVTLVMAIEGMVGEIESSRSRSALDSVG